MNKTQKIILSFLIGLSIILSSAIVYYFVGNNVAVSKKITDKLYIYTYCEMMEIEGKETCYNRGKLVYESDVETIKLENKFKTKLVAIYICETTKCSAIKVQNNPYDTIVTIKDGKDYLCDYESKSKIELSDI